MAKSMTVGKRENEKKRLAKREEKLKKNMMIIPNIIDHLYRLVKTTARMLKLKNSANRLFRTLKFHTIQKLWKNSTESILKVQERLPEMVSII